MANRVAEETAELPRKSVSIALNTEAREVIENLRSDTGIPNTEALTRILEWFSTQDRKFRLAILSRDEDTRRELAGLALRDMAAMSKVEQLDAAGELTHEQAAAMVRTLLESMEKQHRSVSLALADRLKDERKKK